MSNIMENNDKNKDYFVLAKIESPIITSINDKANCGARLGRARCLKNFSSGFSNILYDEGWI